MRLQPVILQDHHVALEPLGLDHVDALERAAADGELWKLWFTSVPAPGAMRAYVEAAIDARTQGNALPFAVRDKRDGAIVGSTRLFDFEPELPRVEIGYTWYAASRQRTCVNTACKRLLLAHAFETLQCLAVQFCTDRYNHASQRAIERLGAQRDGILRSHRLRADGSVRDTVAYSIVAAEWPDVKRLLESRLAR
ncbi:MAG: GNAT family N-acetyltransferase [Proteobacteria bacterium]|nr:GNAT family N-acetyltransferase [Pseudomonadota bacterium]